MTEYFTYALSAIDRNYIYVGITSNLERRLSDHENSRNKTTRAYRPFIIIYLQAFSTRQEARDMEKYLKSGAGKELLKTLK